MKKNAFTLIELMITIAILGILTAIVMPTMQDHIKKAKESAAKDNLRILRTAIERYAADHAGVPPGGKNKSAGLNYLDMLVQLTKTTTLNGTVTNDKVNGFGPYLSKLPANPFNNKVMIKVLGAGNALTPDDIDESSIIHGWVYQPQTKQITINQPGNDSEGKPFFDY